MPGVYVSFTCLLEQSYLTSRGAVARAVMLGYIPHTCEIFLCTRKCFVDWTCVLKEMYSKQETKSE